MNWTGGIYTAVWLLSGFFTYLWIDKNWKKPVSEIPGLLFREEDRDLWMKAHGYKRPKDRKDEPVTVGDVFMFSCGGRWYTILMACLVVGPFGLLFLFAARYREEKE